jgi:hypothetical protein
MNRLSGDKHFYTIPVSGLLIPSHFAIQNYCRTGHAEIIPLGNFYILAQKKINLPRR